MLAEVPDVAANQRIMREPVERIRLRDHRTLVTTVLTIAVLAPPVFYVGVVRGVAHSIDVATAASRHLRDAGDFPTARVIDGQLAEHAGPLEILRPGTAREARLALAEEDASILLRSVPDRVARGQADLAVTALDDIARDPGRMPAAVRAELPRALLAAGRQSLTQQDFATALGFFQRLVKGFPGTPGAVAAQRLLDAPQPVGGTIVQHGGAPQAAPLRLGLHHVRAGDGYSTSGPLYYAAADAAGDFTFAAVPIGGPYVLEIFSGGDWVTLIDPGTGRPSDSITVSALKPVDLAFIVLP